MKQFLARHLPRGLSARIHLSFLVIALAPALVAGLVGIYFSLETLKRETLAHLQSEVSGQADALGRFVDQLASELNYLASSSTLGELADAPTGRRAAAARLRARLRERAEADFSAFAKAYPFIYQIRMIGLDGHERVRVDRHGDGLYVVPEAELQDKSERYYVRDALATGSDRLYVSPLDLNRERGVVETPARPVVRFATGIAGADGELRGILVVNLHAEFVLRNMRTLGRTRGGETYLFDRSGYFLQWREGHGSGFEMRPVAQLGSALPREVVEQLMGGREGTASAGQRIVAFAPVSPSGPTVSGATAPLQWSIAVAYPERRLFAAVFNLYLLYAVLAVALLLAAGAGFLLSRRLLRPLSTLQAETQQIAEGNFSHRIEVRGKDEIAELGASFNRMADKIEDMLDDLSQKRDQLENQVAARTAQLAMERQNLDTVVQNTVDGILALDRRGRIEIANQAASEILGLERDKLPGCRLAALWPPAADLLGAEADGARRQFEYDGRTLEAASSTILDADGRMAKQVLLLRDVTEERQLQESRRELDRQMFQTEKMTTMGELAMGIAHEIGNPLAGMQMVVQALQGDPSVNERMHKYLGRLGKEIDRLSAFLQPFHGFAGAQEPQPCPTSLDVAVQDVLLWTRKEANNEGIRIDSAGIDGALPLLWADPNQLKQVLLNLVINAIHAMSAGGTLHLAAAPDPGDDGRLQIMVADDGVGIAEELLPRIFDPFFTTRPDGTGLGMSIVKKIAADHGAQISIASAPDKGTRVRLSWPIASSKQRQGEKGVAKA